MTTMTVTIQCCGDDNNEQYGVAEMMTTPRMAMTTPEKTTKNSIKGICINAIS